MVDIPEIPKVDDVTPLTEAMEERLSELFQLYIDSEITDPVARAKIEALAHANPDVENLFADQMDITKTIEKEMKSLKPSVKLAANVKQEITRSASISRNARLFFGVLLLAAIVLIIVVIALAGRISHGALILSVGKLKSDNAMVETGRAVPLESIIEIPGTFDNPDNTAVGAVFGDDDRTVRLSHGAVFRMHEESGTIRIELVKGPVRLEATCKEKRIEVVVDNTVAAIPFEEGESARISKAEIYVDGAGTMRLSVISAAARVYGGVIKSQEQIHEGQQVIIPRGKGIQSQRNVDPERLKWKEP